MPGIGPYAHIANEPQNSPSFCRVGAIFAIFEDSIESFRGQVCINDPISWRFLFHISLICIGFQQWDPGFRHSYRY